TVVAQWANPLLTGATVDRLLQVNRIGSEGFAPGNLGRRKERHDWDTGRGGEVRGAAIGRDQKLGRAHGCLGEADRRGYIGERDVTRMVRHFLDSACLVAFRGPAQDERRSIELNRDATSKLGEIRYRP